MMISMYTKEQDIMRQPISELKRRARKALRGKYALLIGAAMLLSIITGMGSSFSRMLFGGSTGFFIVMGQVFSFILSLVLSIFSAGMAYIYLNVSRGRQTGYGDLFYMFGHHPDRVILVSLVMSVIQYICMLPGLIYSYRMPFSGLINMTNTANMTELLRRAMVFYLLVLAGTVISTLLTLPFAFSYYLVIDDDETGPGEALLGSMRMMKGNYGRYIYMLLSFIGLLFLGVLSGGLGLLWVQPYMEVTIAGFYRDLTGEFGSVTAAEAGGSD